MQVIHIYTILPWTTINITIIILDIFFVIQISLGHTQNPWNK